MIVTLQEIQKNILNGNLFIVYGLAPEFIYENKDCLMWAVKNSNANVDQIFSVVNWLNKAIESYVEGLNQSCI